MGAFAFKLGREDATPSTRRRSERPYHLAPASAADHDADAGATR
jgi:hypothetical protein